MFLYLNFESDVDIIVETNQLYPNFLKLFKIALTIPIVSASCERSICAVKDIKISFTPMLSDVFSNISILYTEKDLSKTIPTTMAYIF